jgi:DNA (cytosine-5)-methyltransferase 1
MSLWVVLHANHSALLALAILLTIPVANWPYHSNAIDEKRMANGQPTAIIAWENVPGVLNTTDNAFGHFLAGLAGEDCALQPPGHKWPDAGCVFGPRRSVVWRVLNAEYFGLAQRRNRVFVVASDRSGADPTKILFESESSRRDTPPRRETGPETTWPTAPCLTKSGRGVSRVGEIGGQDTVVAFCDPVAACLTKACLTKACLTKAGSDQETLVAFRAAGQDGFTPSSISPPLLKTAGGGAGIPTVSFGWHVRRITPEEAEALQGYPRHYTRIWYRNKIAADQPRYGALGNTMAVNVMAWLGKRINVALNPPVVN